nr:hypothetical protein L203_00523 [Cryptococcus depauperatus CBS 7841]
MVVQEINCVLTSFHHDFQDNVETFFCRELDKFWRVWYKFGSYAIPQNNTRKIPGKSLKSCKVEAHFSISHANKGIVFGPYILLPLVAAFTWLGGILALLGLWIHAGKPRYKGDEASVVFISDVGAAHHTLFIVICSVVASFYTLSLLAERWLRHVKRLPINLRRRERVFSILTIFWGIIGSVGLVLLSVYDTFHHGRFHWSMTVVFVVSVAISAIFQSCEIWSLHKGHPDKKSLKRNSIFKLIVVIAAIAGAVAFAATYSICRGDSTSTRGHSASTCNRITSVAAALEWTVAFLLTFYFLTLAADLWPAGKSSPRYMRRLAKWQEKHGEGHDFTGRKAFGLYPERWQDGAQVMQENRFARNK